jgi:endo-1,4-beta-D-glucanase Y
MKCFVLSGFLIFYVFIFSLMANDKFELKSKKDTLKNKQPVLVNYPFPLHPQYVSNIYKPNAYTLKQLDDSTRAFYTIWKNLHVRKNCPDPSQYYILNDENRSDGRSRANICVSEGQGYGMIITVIMAGYDPEAQTIFNGLYRLYKSHPSSIDPYLMTWNILTGCKSKIAGDNNNSATDGDLDIALSLLMADKQWGSNGGINYRQEAIKMIQAIKEHEINPQTYSVLISDALQPDDPQYFDTRASDFMPGHFREFFSATQDSSWLKVIDTGYSIFKHIQGKHSPASGLIPDFLQYVHQKYIPAKPKYMESDYDGNYYYNACRVPMRLSADYFLWGDDRAFELIDKMNHWIIKKTAMKPDKLYSGFMLSGSNIKGNDYSTPAFIAPFVVSAMVGSENQKWLNELYPFLMQLDYKDFRYYNNTLKMFCLLMISGNYWTPSVCNITTEK